MGSTLRTALSRDPFLLHLPSWDLHLPFVPSRDPFLPSCGRSVPSVLRSVPPVPRSVPSVPRSADLHLPFATCRDFCVDPGIEPCGTFHPPRAATWGAWRHPMDRPYEKRPPKVSALPRAARLPAQEEKKNMCAEAHPTVPASDATTGNSVTSVAILPRISRAEPRHPGNLTRDSPSQALSSRIPPRNRLAVALRPGFFPPVSRHQPSRTRNPPQIA